ncbi:MAG: hypothetical protein JWM59_1194 [Verrucomicrobiales bacterium]|nr:hypothetical protein [Verrucomicrobiales bacterium]
MTKLHFMHRSFSGHCWDICNMLEDEKFRKSLVFEDSWYFLHHQFFCRDGICSETSATVQTHLYNLASVLYRDFESWTVDGPHEVERYTAIITELVEVAEYSSSFPVSLWSFGDETTREFLDERLAPLPSSEQISHFLKLPHMTRHELERIPYRYSEPKLALKRYRNELAAFNRRRKLAAKNAQRSQ